MAKIPTSYFDEIVDYFKKMNRSGADDIPLEDAADLITKKGRPKKPLDVNPNEYELSKQKNNLELGDSASSPVSVNEIDAGVIDPITLKKGRPQKSSYIDPNERELLKSKSKLELGESPSTEVNPNEFDFGDIKSVDESGLPISSKGLDAVGGNKPLVSRSSSEPSVSGKLLQKKDIESEVIGKGTSKNVKKSSDVIDAEVIDKMPEGPIKETLKKNRGSSFGNIIKNNKGKSAIIAALAAAGLMYDDSEKSDTTTVGKEQVDTDKKVSDVFRDKDVVNQSVSDSLRQNSTVSSKSPINSSELDSSISKSSIGTGGSTRGDSIKNIIDSAVKAAQVVSPKEEAEEAEIDYLKLLKDAQAQDAEDKRNMAMFKAATTVGAGIAGVEPDYKMANEMEKAIGGKSKDIASQMETSKLQSAFRKEKLTEKQQKALRDPASQESKQIRDTLRVIIPDISDSVSGEVLLKVYPDLARQVSSDKELKSLETRSGRDFGQRKLEFDTQQSALTEKKIKEQKEEAELSDVDSDVSRTMNDLAIKAGLIKEGTRVSANTLKKMGINLTSVLNAQESARTRENLFNIAKIEKETKEKEKSEEKLKESQKLAPKQVDSLTALDNAESEIRNVVDLLGNESGWVGPVDELIPKMFIGDKQTAFRSAVGKIEDVYRHAITGAGAGKAELGTLRERVPNVGDQLSQFKAKANEALADIGRKRQILLKNLEKQGKNVTEYKPVEIETNEDKQSSKYSPGQEAGISAHMKAKGINREEALKQLTKAGLLK